MPQVCVDLFITSQAYVDMASISDIPRTTGGQVASNIYIYIYILIKYLFILSFCCNRLVSICINDDIRYRVPLKIVIFFMIAYVFCVTVAYASPSFKIPVKVLICTP